MRSTVFYGIGCMVWIGFVACGEGEGASLRSGDTRGRDGSSPRPPSRDASPADAATDASTDADVSSSSSSSGASDDDSGDAEPVLPGYCRIADAFGLSLPVPGLTSVQNAVEFTITPDERSIAWLEAGPGSTQLYVAARASEAAEFETAAVVAYADPTFANAKGLSISADGLHLVLVSSDQSALGELSRASRDLPFGTTIDRAPYALIEPDVASEGSPLGYPVLGRDDHMLAIARIRPSTPSYSVLVAERAQPTDLWPLPSPRTEGVLAVPQAGSNQPKIVTGISVDGLTLFVRNEVTDALFAVNRPNEAGTFEPAYARPLAAAHAAIPNAPCDRIYVLEAGALLVRRRVEE